MVFGPTIAEEAERAGVGDLGLVFWPESGEITGRENLTAEENAILDGVISGHDPTKKIVIEKPVDLGKLRNILLKKGIIKDKRELD